MLAFIVFAVLFVLMLICTVIYLYPGSASRPTTAPGPEPLDDLEGNLPDIAKSGSFHEFLRDLHETYGPIASFYYGPQLTISLASPQLFKEHLKVFDRPPILFQIFEPLITESSIQFANGASGRQKHAAYKRCFSDAAIRQHFAIFNKFSADLVEVWKSLSKDEHINLEKYMFAYAIKVILKAAYGAHFDNDENVMAIKRSYDVCWSDMESRVSGDLPVAGSKREQRFEENKKIFFDIMQSVVDNRKESNPSGEQLFVDVLLELGLSEDVIQADMVTMVVGGLHTSGLLMTWAVYFLASHPDIQDKVYAHIMEVIGEDEVNETNVNELGYLQQVLDETLRCATLATMAARYQEMDVEIGGHKIPANTPVVHALGVVSEDAVLYPQPDMFDPERFSPENVKSRPSLSFEPFGFAGQRKCPGYKLSLAESKVLICDLLRKFRIDLVPGQVVTKTYGLVTSPKEDIWITIAPRIPKK